MKKALSFDDVLIVPNFSNIVSRQDCNTTVSIGGLQLEFGLMSANMDTVTGSKMSEEMFRNGGIGVLHRFCSIKENINMMKNSYGGIASIGITKEEKLRAEALVDSRCEQFMIDVAHGASQSTADMFNYLAGLLSGAKDPWIGVGNFATYSEYAKFESLLIYKPNAIKVGVGGGSMCTTRIVTGCGLPTLASLLDFKEKTNVSIIADGGIKNSGDIAKCYAAGATAVMVGSLLAGTDETPGEAYLRPDGQGFLKKYRGSASLESYEVQGKIAKHRSPEGEATIIQCKGPVAPIIQQLQAGLKSAMSYVGAHNIESFKENAELVEITSSGMSESKPHGKK